MEPQPAEDSKAPDIWPLALVSALLTTWVAGRSLGELSTLIKLLELPAEEMIKGGYPAWMAKFLLFYLLVPVVAGGLAALGLGLMKVASSSMARLSVRAGAALLAVWTVGQTYFRVVLDPDIGIGGLMRGVWHTLILARYPRIAATAAGESGYRYGLFFGGLIWLLVVLVWWVASYSGDEAES